MEYGIHFQRSDISNSKIVSFWLYSYICSIPIVLLIVISLLIIFLLNFYAYASQCTKYFFFSPFYTRDHINIFLYLAFHLAIYLQYERYQYSRIRFLNDKWWSQINGSLLSCSGRIPCPRCWLTVSCSANRTTPNSPPALSISCYNLHLYLSLLPPQGYKLQKRINATSIA